MMRPVAFMIPDVHADHRTEPRHRLTGELEMWIRAYAIDRHRAGDDRRPLIVMATSTWLDLVAEMTSRFGIRLTDDVLARPYFEGCRIVLVEDLDLPFHVQPPRDPLIFGASA